MLMTTILLAVYLYLEKKNWFLVIALLAVYLTIEGSFLIANMFKFVHGGWVTILIAACLFFIMYVWFKGREIKKSFLQFVKIDEYKDVIVNLSNDKSLPKYASNLVYLTKADLETDIESKIIYSIIHKRPKRADTYWLIHIHIVDEPRTMEYSVNPIVPNVLIRVEFRLGYKVDSRINLYFKQVLDDLVANKEIDITSKYQSLHNYHIMSDFRYVVIERIQNYDFDFKTADIQSFVIVFRDKNLFKSQFVGFRDAGIDAGHGADFTRQSHLGGKSVTRVDGDVGIGTQYRGDDGKVDAKKLRPSQLRP